MRTALLLLLVLVGMARTSAPPEDLDFDTLGRLTVQHEGRWVPLRTLARDISWRLTGRQARAGEEPLEMLLALTFEGRALGGQPGQRRLRERLFSGDLIRPVPDPRGALLPWRSVHWLVGAGATEAPAAAAAWLELGSAFLARAPQRFESASRELVRTLDALPAALRPDAERLRKEALSNPQAALMRAAWLLVGGAVGAALSALWPGRWQLLATGLALLGGLTQLARCLWLRGQLAGHLPATNMYESLLWLALGAATLAALVFAWTRRGPVPALAAALAALALFAAEGLGLDPFIRPAPAVLLGTAWMSFHVPVTMFAYAVLGVAVLLAHGRLLQLAFWPTRAWGQVLEARLLVAVHAGALLLFLGIASGSMWAASSWGRAWGWDPKEVWSLIALLGYMVIVHVQLDLSQTPRWARVVAGLGAAATLATIFACLPAASPLVLGLVSVTAGALSFLVLARGSLALALKVLVAFWMIVVTYVAVNFVLASGLHSYGFGAGSAGRGLALAAALELVFAGGCSAFAYRRGPTHRAALPRPGGTG